MNVKQYTLVCTTCHSGWYSDQPDGVCSRCGRDAICRGVTLQIPLGES